MLPRVLIADRHHPHPTPGELLIWIGSGDPQRRRNVVQVQTAEQAVALLGPRAQVRVALTDPLDFFRHLA